MGMGIGQSAGMMMGGYPTFSSAPAVGWTPPAIAQPPPLSGIKVNIPQSVAVPTPQSNVDAAAALSTQNQNRYNAGQYGMGLGNESGGGMGPAMGSMVGKMGGMAAMA